MCENVYFSLNTWYGPAIASMENAKEGVLKEKNKVPADMFPLALKIVGSIHCAAHLAVVRAVHHTASTAGIWIVPLDSSCVAGLPY